MEADERQRRILALARHDGRVEVTETPGGGATFRVRLPIAPPEPVAPTETSSAAARAPEVDASETDTPDMDAPGDDPDAISATRSSDR